MGSQSPENPIPKDFSGYRSVRFKLKVVFSCLTAIPFFVFAYIYFNLSGFTSALSGFLIALVLILVLEGFIVFRRMAEQIEILSSMMSRAGKGEVKKVDSAGETRELALIADSFNKTLAKLDGTAKELGIRAAQASTLNEIREIASQSINLEEIAKTILSQTMQAINARAGFLAVSREDEETLRLESWRSISPMN